MTIDERRFYYADAQVGALVADPFEEEMRRHSRALSGVRVVHGRAGPHEGDPQERRHLKVPEEQAILLLAHIMLLSVGSALLAYGSISGLWSMVYGAVGLIALSGYDLLRRRRSIE